MEGAARSHGCSPARSRSLTRVAVVSDIHGNLTALEAIIADLADLSPDLVLHGGDLAHGGARPTGVLDRIRELGWPGVMGNVDEMLFHPASLDAFAAPLPQLNPMWDAIREMAAWTRDALGTRSIAWLAALPRVFTQAPLALVHASPESTWRSPRADAPGSELESVYGSLHAAVAVYGHIHIPFVRPVSGMTVANSGSAGLPYDGDPRASYLLLDYDQPTIRRVEYDLAGELAELAASGLPHADWVAAMLQTAQPAAFPG